MKTKNTVRKLTIIYGWLEANFFFQLLLLIYMHYSLTMMLWNTLKNRCWSGTIIIMISLTLHKLQNIWWSYICLYINSKSHSILIMSLWDRCYRSDTFIEIGPEAHRWKLIFWKRELRVCEYRSWCAEQIQMRSDVRGMTGFCYGHFYY